MTGRRTCAHTQNGVRWRRRYSFLIFFSLYIPALYTHTVSARVHGSFVGRGSLTNTAGQDAGSHSRPVHKQRWWGHGLTDPTRTHNLVLYYNSGSQTVFFFTYHSYCVLIINRPCTIND